ncbi:MAG: HEPN domain-containing protein [Anaerolineae bacterium]|nr:HEPN domain-containing protein [Anaerolineae bacterium]
MQPVEFVLWIERAEEDYLLAVASLRRKQPLTYGATFHAQQCCEKYLKALLIKNKVDFPRTHDLAALNSLCSKNSLFLTIKDDDLEYLSAFAVEARYPGTTLTYEEAKEALTIARRIRKQIRKYLNK